jgi:hypothetical protein
MGRLQVPCVRALCVSPAHPPIALRSLNYSHAASLLNVPESGLRYRNLRPPAAPHGGLVLLYALPHRPTRQRVVDATGTARYPLRTGDRLPQFSRPEARRYDRLPDIRFRASAPALAGGPAAVTRGGGIVAASLLSSAYTFARDNAKSGDVNVVAWH